MRIFVATLVLALTAVGQLSAQPFVIIDNYNQTNFNLTANSVTTSVAQYDTGLSTSNTMGGSRISRAHFVSGGGGGDQLNVNNTANPGFFEVSCSTTASGHFHSYYGYSAYDTSTEDPVAVTHTFTDMNTNVQGVLGSPIINVALDFQTLDHPMTLIFKIVTNHTGGGQTVSVVSKPVAAQLTPFNVTFTNAELVAGITSGPGLNFTDVDQVILQSADLPGGTDFLADNFRFFVSVPEPTTYALIGVSSLVIGAGAYLQRRRQNKLANSSIG